MSEESPPKKKESSGAPAWVMTFADLMSLLMCFFVLLLSFSEMDLLKFKQIAGSMKVAFGVQREIKANESPKGTSIIAREFTPGRPTPTLIKEIKQSTIDETKQTLEFTDATTQEKDAESIDPNQESEGSGSDAMRRQPQSKFADSDIPIDKEEIAKLSDQEESNLGKADQNEQIEQLEEKLESKTFKDALKLVNLLEQEIEQGLVEIKTQGNRILLRIDEKGSFPSGSATVKSSFLPVLNKLRTSLNQINGNIIVAGHTDNIPIKTARFRSNWELSSSRAVTVVHALLQNDNLKPERFIIEGHGDAHPIAINDDAIGRARNRRVEITIVQQDENDNAVNIISADNPFTSHLLDAETPALSTNVQRILEQEIAIPEALQSDVKAESESIKTRFELIRDSLKN
ncbi:MAG: flagellar motor protein MotB [Pseudomonadota bacterium]